MSTTANITPPAATSTATTSPSAPRVTTVKKRRELHGLSHSAEYDAWQHMKTRCYNPKSSNYKWYGRRGIKVWPAWKRSFKAFLRYVGFRPSPLHSLGRRDSNADYRPGNVEWQTRQRQNNSRRSTDIIIFGGVRCSLMEWSRTLGMNRGTLWTRLHRLGWSMADVIADVKAKQDAPATFCRSHALSHHARSRWQRNPHAVRLALRAYSAMAVTFRQRPLRHQNHVGRNIAATNKMESK